MGMNMVTMIVMDILRLLLVRLRQRWDTVVNFYGLGLVSVAHLQGIHLLQESSVAVPLEYPASLRLLHLYHDAFGDCHGQAPHFDHIAETERLQGKGKHSRGR